MWMVAMETKIKHFTYYSCNCIWYHAKILKFSFGHKDFHITDYITKCQVLNWWQWKLKYKCNVHGCHGNKNTEFDKSANRTQQKLFSSIDFSIILKIKYANFPMVNVSC